MHKEDVCLRHQKTSFSFGVNESQSINEAHKGYLD